MIKWFGADTMVLNLDETNIMKFITNNLSHSTLHIAYKEKYVEEMVNTEFHGLQIDNHLKWKNRAEQIIPKLSAVRSMVHISNCTNSQITLLHIL
jgi:hypothetical protein